ncbi:MAG TPA: hypothetical protein VLO07_03130 [Thermoanaerobaculia bacterium]|nr:hypothetical protein [Thermoanaerobaculia bacterium]
MADTSGRTRFVVGALLLTAVVISSLAAWQLETLGKRPARPLGYFVVFGVSFVLALAAGRLVPFVVPRNLPSEEKLPVTPHGRALRLLAALAALTFFGWTWILQGLPEPPLGVLATWAAALLAGALACSIGGRRSVGVPRKEPGASALHAVLLVILILATGARMIGLEAMPPCFGGDEAAHTLDGVKLICGEDRTGRCGTWRWEDRSRPHGRSDPFGTGFYYVMRLGMLPAGVGALFGHNRIAGPRVPYAIAGSLSAAACAVAAGLLTGPWGAVACAALIAFSPHHVHFSRVALMPALDALLAILIVVFLIGVRRSGSPFCGFLAGVAAGLSFYGYSGGRAAVLVFLLCAPFAFFGSPAAGRMRGVLLLALLGGFGLAAAPNLRLAFDDFGEWNRRFARVTILRQAWWGPASQALGSPFRVLREQFLAGTIDLLCTRSGWAWFTGYPLVSPFFLPPLALAGLGWMAGRRQIFGASVLTLLGAGNFAGLILTESAPAPQRMSSLIPVCAILGGVAVAGFLTLLPGGSARGGPWRTAVGALVIGGILFSTYRGSPRVWEPSPGYGRDGAVLSTSLYRAFGTPRYRGEVIWLHSLPNIDSRYPPIGYLLPQIRWVDVAPERENDVPTRGIHVFVREWMPLGRQWRQRLRVGCEMALSDPDEPRRDIALAFRAPG